MKFGAHTTVKRGQTDAGEKVSHGNADFGIGRTDFLLCHPNIGPSLQQRGGQAHWDLDGQFFGQKRCGPRHGSWIAPQQCVNLVFLEGDLALDFGDVGRDRP